MGKISSRTKNTAMNISSAFVGQLVGQFSNLIVRTFFIHVLEKTYLGVNGLFTNILTVLSLAEMGVGSALVYSMYKPMAEKNVSALQAYMNFYKKVYYTIGIGVTLVGLSITPFLDFFMAERPDISSLELIYVLYVVRTGSSYFFAYKQSIFRADQKVFYITNATTVTLVVKSIAEIIVLVTTKNFIVYLLIEVIFTFGQNVVLAFIADKKYPFLKEHNQTKLNKDTFKELAKNIRALFVHKVSSVVLNSTDSIVISKYVSVVAVGIYSNYATIITVIMHFLNTISDGILPSVGNLFATAKTEKAYSIYKGIDYMFSWMVGFCAVALYLLFNPFILIWAGQEYLFDEWIVAAIVVSFYIQMNMRPISMVRSANGLFYNDRYFAVAQCIINLGVSVVLVKYMGICGVFIGTSIALLCTLYWIQPCLVYKKVFHKPLHIYFCEYFGKVAIWVAALLISKWCFGFVATGNVGADFVVKAVITAVIPNVLFLLATLKTEEFLFCKNRIVRIFKKK